MKLENGKMYVARNGSEHVIGGDVRDFPEWCWSTSGWWFVRATGEHVSYRRVYSRPGEPVSGEHFIDGESRLTLIKEVV